MQKLLSQLDDKKIVIENPITTCTIKQGIVKLEDKKHNMGPWQITKASCLQSWSSTGYFWNLCLLSHLKASIIIHVSLSTRKKNTKSFGGPWQTTAYIFVSFGFILIRKVGSQNVSGWIRKHLNIDSFCPEFHLTLDCSVAYPLTKQSVPSNRNNKHNVNEILTDS